MKTKQIRLGKRLALVKLSERDVYLVQRLRLPKAALVTGAKASSR